MCGALELIPMSSATTITTVEIYTKIRPLSAAGPLTPPCIIFPCKYMLNGDRVIAHVPAVLTGHYKTLAMQFGEDILG